MKVWRDVLLSVLLILVAGSCAHASAPLEEVAAQPPPAKLNFVNVSSFTSLRVPVSK
jgi:hypothetical protein